MAEPVRHRQTKGAATDMFDLPPPRHIPTLRSTEARVGPARPSVLPLNSRWPVYGATSAVRWKAAVQSSKAYVATTLGGRGGPDIIVVTWTEKIPLPS